MLVVERRLRERSEARRDAGELVAATAERAQRVDCARTRCRELVEHLDDGELGVLCCGDTLEWRRSRRKHLADERRLHRVVEGRATLRREHARTEQLGEPVEHEEPDVEQAVAATPELAPKGQAGEVAGHDHGDRRERVTTLRRADRCPQRIGGGRAERDGQQTRCALDGPTRLHVANRSEGV